MMQPLTRSDLIAKEEYESERDATLASLTVTKEQLRIPVGEDIVVVFETRESVLGAILELRRYDSSLSETVLDEVLSSSATLLPDEDSFVCSVYSSTHDASVTSQDQGITILCNNIPLEITWIQLDSGEESTTKEIEPCIGRISLPSDLHERWLEGPVVLKDLYGTATVELNETQRTAILASKPKGQ